jgi:hypothetical protein
MDDLHLTEERIRSVVRESGRFNKRARSRSARRDYLPVPEALPDIAAGENLIHLMKDSLDAAMGPGAGVFVADNSRLIFLLSVLEQGTVDDALAAHDRKVARFDKMAGNPAVAEMAHGNAAIYAAQIRAIPQHEIDAVMACLDDIATIYPGQVQAVRARHDPGFRETLDRAAATLRTGDSTRPQLTEARIRRLLEVLSAIVPGTKMLIRSLNETGFVLQAQPAAKQFPATTVKKIRTLGEDAEEFARDYAWLRIIYDHIRRGGTIDERLSAALPMRDAEAWMHLLPKARSERLAAAMSRPIELLSRVGREEEEAVRTMIGEIEERLTAVRAIQREANAASRQRQSAKAVPDGQ